MIEFEMKLQEVKYKWDKTLFKWIIIWDKVIDEFNKNRTVLSYYNVKFLDEREQIFEQLENVIASM